MFEMSASARTPARRKPAQERSRERYEKLLDAAVDLIGEVGIERATLTDVALRADCAIGSLYQYFSGKEQLLDAVIERLARRFSVLRAGILKDSDAATLTTFVPTVIRPIVEFWSRYPATIHLLDRMREHVPSPQRAVDGTLNRLLIAQNPHLTRERRSLIARTTVELIKASLHALARTSLRERRALLNEFECAIVSYLCSAARSIE
jgi:AcrR family transcriptional regulator